MAHRTLLFGAGLLMNLPLSRGCNLADEMHPGLPSQMWKLCPKFRCYASLPAHPGLLAHLLCTYSLVLLLLIYKAVYIIENYQEE